MEEGGVTIRARYGDRCFGIGAIRGNTMFPSDGQFL